MAVQNGNSFTANAVLGTNDNYTLAFETNGTTRLTLGTDGHLLPASDDAYDLGGTSNRFRDLYLGAGSLHIGTSATAEGIISYTDDTQDVLNIGSDATGNADIAFFTDDMYFDKSTGRIGIDTTSPSYKLHLIGTMGTQVSSVGENVPYTVNLTRANTDGDSTMISFYTNTAVTPDFFGKFGFKFQGGTADANRQFQVMKPAEPTLMAMRNMYKNSWGRSRYVYGALNQAIGAIDLGFMKRLYKRSGSFPPGTIKEIRKQYNKTGEWGEYSIGHASNALVAIMKPDNGSEGYYALCVGTAARGLAPLTPTRAAPIYGETNAFWEIRLADNPMELTAAARQCAQEYIRQAGLQVSKLNAAEVAFAPLKDLLDLAQGELANGLTHATAAEIVSGNESVYEWARATRCFTRAQVRALQVCQALVP